jgi:glucose/arabinose dehydrogenase
MRAAFFKFLNILLVLFLSASVFSNPVNITASPQQPNFTETNFISGLNQPIKMEFAPDGRLFVVEKVGNIRVIKNGTLLPTPFLTLPVDTYFERGFQGIAFDPNFSSNRYVYLFYTSSTTSKNRVSRFTASAANPDVVEAGSEKVLIDNIPNDGGYHMGGAVNFGSDGKLHITTGDGGTTPNTSQDLNLLAGKILRINSDGTIPSDNPYVGQSGKRPEIWASGLRNPFTATIEEGTGRYFINDVGQASWEEIDQGVKGANYGWPVCEGNCTTAGMTNPFYTYSHSIGHSIVGGDFYHGSKFPSQYQSDYFFGDYSDGWIKNIDFTNGNRIKDVKDFANNLSGLVDMEFGPDDALYYLSFSEGKVNKIDYIKDPKGSGVTEAQLLAGLAGYWKLDETSGSNYFDISNYANHLTKGPQTTSGIGKINGGLSNNGSSFGANRQYTLGNPLNFSSSTTPSFAFWLKVTSLQSPTRLIETPSDYGWGVEYLPNGSMQLITYGISVVNWPSVVAADNNWHHYTLTHDGTNAKLYKDGTLVSTQAYQASWVQADRVLYVGGDQSYPLRGIVDEVGIWTRVLSVAEISKLYNNGQGFAFTKNP